MAESVEEFYREIKEEEAINEGVAPLLFVSLALSFGLGLAAAVELVWIPAPSVCAGAGGQGF